MTGKKASDEKDAVSNRVSKKPPGRVWKHPKTGRLYWRLMGKHLPEALKKTYKTERVFLPLIPDGMAEATLWEIMAAGGWKSPQIVTRDVNIARAANRLPEKPIGGP